MLQGDDRLLHLRQLALLSLKLPELIFKLLSSDLPAQKIHRQENHLIWNSQPKTSSKSRRTLGFFKLPHER